MKRNPSILKAMPERQSFILVSQWFHRSLLLQLTVTLIAPFLYESGDAEISPIIQLI